MNYLEQVSEWRSKVNRRDLSPNTTKDYKTSIKKLISVLGEDLISVCKDYDKVLDKLRSEGHKESRIRNFFNIYVQIMRANSIDESFIVPYTSYIQQIQDNYVEEQKSNHVTSENHIKNMITYKQFLTYISMLKDSNDKIESMIYTILIIMKHKPYRVNEFTKMKYINKKTFTKDNVNNYVVKAGWNYEILFQQYETTKSRPTAVQYTNKEMSKILRKYIKDNNIASGDMLFPYSPEYLSQLMVSTSQKYISKSVGSQIIRKVIVSYHYQATKDKTQEQEAFAKSIGHSLAIENLVYNKSLI